MGKKQAQSQDTIDQELAEIQRKYRSLESQKKEQDNSTNLIRKQKAYIEKLRKENSNAKSEGKMASDLAEKSNMTTKSGKEPATLSASQQIAKLQDQADTYTRKLELEKRRIEELDKQIKLMNHKIMDQRQKMGGVNASKENNAQISKQIRVLENRLDKSLVKYNEAVAYNKQLKEQIDNLRREKVVFDGVYKKLERELQEKKREMAEIIEISNIAYEARDNAQKQMNDLKAMADKEQAAFEAEMKELEKLIEQDRKMKDFMKLNQKGPGADNLQDMGQEEEKSLKRKVVKGSWAMAKDKAAQQVSQEKVQSYEEAFAKIQQATGISDIDELVTKFINAEDQNFSLFNYVNELNNEIEKLEEQIADIKSEIEKYKGQGINADNQRKKILRDLEERLQKTEMKAEYYESKYNTAMKTINSLKSGIHSIFNKIGCQNCPGAEMLRDQGVTEQNMMQYLGIIEQRTNEILQMYVASQAQQGGDDRASVPLLAIAQGPQTPAGGPPLTIHPPTTGEEFGSEDETDEEDEERPMTRDELKQKTLRGLHKREQQRKAKAKLDNKREEMPPPGKKSIAGSKAKKRDD